MALLAALGTVAATRVAAGAAREAAGLVAVAGAVASVAGPTELRAESSAAREAWEG